jgi:branched-chain amino acid transport system substrate-binding protein
MFTMFLNKYRYMLLGIVLGVAGMQNAFAQHTGEQFYPLFTYRTGPYANVGISIIAGQRDMLAYLAATEGGVDGVKNFTVECETSYDIDKGIECFDRYVHGYQGAPIATITSMSSGLFAATIQRNNDNKVPHMIPGGGTAFGIDGRYNPYQVSVMFDYWREAQVVVAYVAQRLGGYDKLKGQVIATMYHDSGYGRDTIQPMKLLSEKYGFTDVQIPVAHPGVQQEAQWAQVRNEKVNWVFYRGWGAMTPVGIKTAKRTGFPADHIIGDIWSTSEDDVRPAGDAALGYTGVNVFPPGVDFKLLQDIKKVVYGKGEGDLKGKEMDRFGTVYYNFGVITSLVYSEMLRTGHKHFGKRPINGEEALWAYEHLDIDQKRLEAIGAVDLMAPLKLSPCNHEGENIQAKVIQWTGNGWKSTDWIKIDSMMFVPTFVAKAESLAKEQDVKPRDLPQCKDWWQKTATAN